MTAKIIYEAELQKAIDALELAGTTEVESVCGADKVRGALITLRAVQEREGPKLNCYGGIARDGTPSIPLYTLPELKP